MQPTIGRQADVTDEVDGTLDIRAGVDNSTDGGASAQSQISIPLVSTLKPLGQMRSQPSVNILKGSKDNLKRLLI